MGLRQRLFSSIFFRTMIDQFGGRTAYTKDNKIFIPYFQYHIGEYQQDYCLYFSKTPLPRSYNNEIFNKLNEYNGYDIIKYLEFHFENYPDKRDFLRFLNYEISERIKSSLPKNRRLKLQTAIGWITEKLTEFRKEQEENLQQKIEKDIHSIVDNHSNNGSTDIDEQIKICSERLAAHMEQLISITESGIKEITSSFVTGNIQLNNRIHEQKIIELLVLLQEAQTGRSEQVFKKCSSTDIAAMLRLHFEAFKDKKLNTLQKKITESTTDLHETKNQKVKQLNEALQDFFSS